MSLEMILAIIANVIAVTALIFHFIDLLRHFVRIRITQLDADEAFAHKITHFADYDFAFLKVRVENLSTVPFGLIEIKLRDSTGKIYNSSEYDMQSYRNPKGAAYDLKDQAGYFVTYDLNHDNWKNNQRVPEHGHVDVFVTFLNGPVLNADKESFTLLVKTTRKTYAAPVVLNKLPENFDWA